MKNLRQGRFDFFKKRPNPCIRFTISHTGYLWDSDSPYLNTPRMNLTKWKLTMKGTRKDHTLGPPSATAWMWVQLDPQSEGRRRLEDQIYLWGGVGSVDIKCILNPLVNCLIQWCRVPLLSLFIIRISSGGWRLSKMLSLGFRISHFMIQVMSCPGSLGLHVWGGRNRGN